MSRSSCANSAAIHSTALSTCLPRPGDHVHPYACLLASTRLKGLPPPLTVSIADPLHDEANAYVAKLQAAAVPVQTVEMHTPAGVDANARRRSSTDANKFAVMATFVASVSNDAA
ncbi:MAG: alpha/beta hydrolase fold domain-containing protein [Burkholderiaceae bacterium]